METRISRKFEELKKADRKAVIPFFMPGAQGDLSVEDMIISLENAGADLIELGVPFSDPIADGPIIQRSAETALENGMNIDNIFKAIKNARDNTQVPLLLLIYFNSIFRYGIERFLNRCVMVGIDGLIIPDLPFEEHNEIKIFLEGLPIDLITLVARTSSERMKMILPNTSGFVYCVSSLGVTGERNEIHGDLFSFLENIKSYTDTPRAVGFGISTANQAQEISKHCEGIIVGSALVRRFLDEGIESGLKFIKELREAIDK